MPGSGHLHGRHARLALWRTASGFHRTARAHRLSTRPHERAQLDSAGAFPSRQSATTPIGTTATMRPTRRAMSLRRLSADFSPRASCGCRKGHRRARAGDALYAQLVERAKKGDANNRLYQVEASMDYDPTDGLGKISARVLAINFEDDELNHRSLARSSRPSLEFPAHSMCLFLPARIPMATTRHCSAMFGRRMSPDFWRSPSKNATPMAVPEFSRRLAKRPREIVSIGRREPASGPETR